VSTKFNNYSMLVGERLSRPYYKWRLFVDEPADRLNQIRSVEYILHPTFPEPVQVRTDPADHFGLETSGWGSFLAAIRVYFKDGRKEDTSYWVDLGKPWPLEASQTR
jgi:transcription initiation factor IIF auxiliary subunit